jgi:hypothetical protein
MPSRVNCINRDGATLWQLDFPPASSERPNAYKYTEFTVYGLGEY